MRMGNNQQDFGADGVFLLKYESNPLLICARTHVLINWDFFLSLFFISFVEEALDLFG